MRNNSKIGFKNGKTKKLYIDQQFKLPDDFERKLVFLEEALERRIFNLEMLNELAALYTAASAHYEAIGKIELFQLYITKSQKLCHHPYILQLLSRRSMDENIIEAKSHLFKVDTSGVINPSCEVVVNQDQSKLKGDSLEYALKKEKLKISLKENRKEYTEKAKTLIEKLNLKQNIDKVCNELSQQSHSFRERLESKRSSRRISQDQLSMTYKLTSANKAEFKFFSPQKIMSHRSTISCSSSPNVSEISNESRLSSTRLLYLENCSYQFKEDNDLKIEEEHDIKEVDGFM